MQTTVPSLIDCFNDEPEEQLKAREDAKEDSFDQPQKVDYRQHGRYTQEIKRRDAKAESKKLEQE